MKKSIIDYILEEDNRHIIIDTKVRRGPEIDSECYKIKRRIRRENQTQGRKSNRI